MTRGPDGAPRDDGSDVRWSSDYRYIRSLHPEYAQYLLGICSTAWDQGAREHPAGMANPFWGLDTEAADAALQQRQKEKSMTRVKAPIEGKVYAAVGGGGAGYILGNAATWALGVFVWDASPTAAAANDALGAVPAPIGQLVTLGVTLGLAAYAGWKAKHTARPDLGDPA